jgi:GGDEF domain-containing protein
MTIAPSTPTGPATAVAPDIAAIADVSVLLPNREDLLVRLVERLPSADRSPATLLIVGLLRRDDGWPTPATTLSAVTMLLARSLRGDDWLGAAGAAEFAIVLSGPESAAAIAGQRLVDAVLALGIPGTAAAAGIAPLRLELAPHEVFRRAALSLTAARQVGPTTVIRYREPV